MNKSQIRKKILKIRKNSSVKKFKINFKYLKDIINKKNINRKKVGGYYPYNHEVDVLEILQELEKKKYLISLPKIRKNFQMDFFKWSLNDPLTINKYGIPEPASNKIIYPDFLLVPLVAFDSDLNRIGYGSGFYDRYIKKIKKKKRIITIGLAFSFQEVRKIKTNKFDSKLDFIITEKKRI